MTERVIEYASKVWVGLRLLDGLDISTSRKMLDEAERLAKLRNKLISLELGRDLMEMPLLISGCKQYYEAPLREEICNVNSKLSYHIYRIFAAGQMTPEEMSHYNFRQVVRSVQGITEIICSLIPPNPSQCTAAISSYTAMHKRMRSEPLCPALLFLPFYTFLWVLQWVELNHPHLCKDPALQELIGDLLDMNSKLGR